VDRVYSLTTARAMHLILPRWSSENRLNFICCMETCTWLVGFAACLGGLQLRTDSCVILVIIHMFLS